MKVSVDSDVCGGHGVCWGLCPEVFELNEDGYAFVTVDAVPVELEEVVRKAVGQCPTGAISISSRPPDGGDDTGEGVDGTGGPG